MKQSFNRGFFKTALALSIPIALQNLLTSSASLVDTAMITGLGELEVEAIGVAGRFPFMLNVVGFGFCSASATLISQYWGAKEKDNIHRTHGLVSMLAISISIILAVALGLFPEQLARIFTNEPEVARLAGEYLRIYAFGAPLVMYLLVMNTSFRATENIKIPFIASAIAVAANTFFNYCLIFGNFGFPRLEMSGAAIATLIGFVVQAIIVTLFFLFSKNEIRASVKKYLDFDFAFFKKYIRVSIPVILNEGMWALGTNLYVVVLGRLDGYSGYVLFDSVQQIFFVFFVGICSASSIMVGKAVGEGDVDTAKRTAKRFLIMTPLMGVVLGAVMILLRDPVLYIMPAETDAIREMASVLLLIYGLWVGIRMIPYTSICGIFRAGGDTKSGCRYEIVSMYLFAIPAVFILGFFTNAPFPLVVFAMFFFEDVPKGILCVKRFFSYRWIKCLTNNATEETK